MKLSPRQLAVVLVLGLCALAAAAICIWAPLRIGILALLAMVALCTLAVLAFLRKTLQALYQVRDRGTASTTAMIESDPAATAAAVRQELQESVLSRLDRIEQHLPERVAVRLAFEQAARAEADRQR